MSAHYDQLAEAVRQATRAVTTSGVAERAAVEEFVSLMAGWLEMLNPRFNSDRFLTAAGFGRLDAETRAMADRYQSGAGLVEVGREFGLSASTVSLRLRSAGVQIRRGGPSKGQRRGARRPPPDEQAVREMAERYQSGATLVEVGEEFGYAGPTVAQHLRTIGVQIRSPGGRHLPSSQGGRS